MTDESNGAVPIDAAKLRGLLRAAHEQYATYRRLTDTFLEMRDDIGRFEGRLASDRRAAGLDKLEIKRRERQIEAMREELGQVAEQRQSLSGGPQHKEALQGLVAYARRHGYTVDEGACTVRPRFAGEPARAYL